MHLWWKLVAFVGLSDALLEKVFEMAREKILPLDPIEQQVEQLLIPAEPCLMKYFFVVKRSEIEL